MKPSDEAKANLTKKQVSILCSYCPMCGRELAKDEDESLKPTEVEATNHETEVRDASERTAALRADNTPIEKMVCFSASDYYHATKNHDFAANYGGVELFRAELFKLLDEWHGSLLCESLTETTEEPTA